MNVKNKNKTLRVLLIIYLAAIIVRIPATSFPFYSISIFINCVAVLYWAFSVKSRIIEDRQRRNIILSPVRQNFDTCGICITFRWYWRRSFPYGSPQA